MTSGNKKSKRSNDDDSRDGNIKRAKFKSLTGSERVYNFPAKMVACLNVGNMKQLEELINEYCVPNVEIKTKLIGNGVSGRAALTNFLSTIYNSCPDMVMRISAIKLNRDCSIVFKGDFEGTYLDGRGDSDTSHKMIVDKRKIEHIVAEARENTNETLTEDEKSRLDGIEQALKADPDMVLRTKATYACRIILQSAKTGAAPNAPAHQLITKLDFDWKTPLIDQSGVAFEDN